MPIVEISGYCAPLLFRNSHLQTVYPSIFRKVEGVSYTRERLITPDDDFLDLDWSRVNSRRLAIILHGLEGDSSRSYIKGMVKAFNSRKWDALALNFRGCSQEPNRQSRMYHSGETRDLALVIKHALSTGIYDKLALIGFSLGGNVILKSLGELGTDVDPRIGAAVAISVPCDLKACSIRLEQFGNRAYSRRFLRMLRKKIINKTNLYPEVMDASRLDSVKTLKQFDEEFTAPLHGFRSADDYYHRSSSLQFLHNISLPTLLLSSSDDPFLAPECYPFEIASGHEWLHLETPRHGGHVGFVSFNQKNEYWSETRAAQFVSAI